MGIYENPLLEQTLVAMNDSWNQGDRRNIFWFLRLLETFQTEEGKKVSL